MLASSIVGFWRLPVVRGCYSDRYPLACYVQGVSEPELAAGVTRTPVQPVLGGEAHAFLHAYICSVLFGRTQAPNSI